VEKRAGSSIFHTRGWLHALHLTYGYQPIAFSTSAPSAELTNCLLFCEIQNWIGGRRLVSLPFSDHCAPIMDRSRPESSQELSHLLEEMREAVKQRRWKSIELRAAPPLESEAGSFQKTRSYRFHTLDLRPGVDELFRRFHKNCVQRKIQRAEREHLRYEAGRSPALLKHFYALQLMTRRRQGLPPQPLSWFRRLVECLDHRITIHIAYSGSVPVAGIVTLLHKDVLVYKYGASDYNFSKLGGTQLLFWKAIQDAKSRGLLEMDLGRSDLDDEGLIVFKERWGAAASTIDYWQCSRRPAEISRSNWETRLVKPLFRHMPDGLLTTVGKVLYKYAG
jgi:CelD/BcsL family acetyltransferase involved in cellulose biosynthesis